MIISISVFREKIISLKMQHHKMLLIFFLAFYDKILDIKVYF